MRNRERDGRRDGCEVENKFDKEDCDDVLRRSHSLALSVQAMVKGMSVCTEAETVSAD